MASLFFKAFQDRRPNEQGPVSAPLPSKAAAGALRWTASSASLPAPKDKAATLILPNEWTPFLDQAAWYLEGESNAWQQARQGVNRISADLGFVQDVRLFQIYVRLDERLALDLAFIRVTARIKELEGDFQRLKA